MSSNLPNVSIGDFAESILNEGQTQSAPPQGSQSFDNSPSFDSMPTPSPGQLDISNVQVPDDFVTSLVEGKESEVEQEQVRAAAPLGEDSGDRLEILLSRLCSLLEETKGLISEMGMTAGAGLSSGATKVGHLGVNQACPVQRKARKKVRKKVRRERKPVAETIEAVLRDLDNGTI